MIMPKNRNFINNFETPRANPADRNMVWSRSPAPQQKGDCQIGRAAFFTVPPAVRTHRANHVARPQVRPRGRPGNPPQTPLTAPAIPIISGA
jgi:hypothetical protein